MAFCEHCGKEIAEGEQCTCQSVDTAAQAPVAEETPVVETPVAEEAKAVAEAPAVKEEAKETKPDDNKNKMVILIAAAAAVVVLIVLVALFAGGSKKYMEPVDDFIAQINKKNTDPVELYSTLMPDFAASLYADTHKKYMVAEDYVDGYEDAMDNMEDYYDDCDDEFGKWKLSFELKKASEMDEDDLEDIQDYLDDYYDDYREDEVDMYEEALEDDDDLEDAADELDISESQAKAMLKASIKYAQAYEKMKVTEGYEVKGKFIVKAGKDEYETSTVEFRVIKINGDWTYWGIADGSLEFDDDDENCLDFLSNFLSGRKLYKSVF